MSSIGPFPFYLAAKQNGIGIICDADSPLSIRSSPADGSSRRRSGERMSSTLVETVSINYEDFSDSFLTCGTCLCVYDGVERAPKLLACSHTVCQSCLEHIIEAQLRGAVGAGGGPGAVVGSFRCPICRETITVPRGGVAAFPPSFIVNQVSCFIRSSNFHEARPPNEFWSIMRSKNGSISIIRWSVNPRVMYVT